MATKPKSHQGTKKRVKFTGSGKMLRRRAYGNHFLTKKSPARKRRYARSYKFKNGDKQNIKETLGV